MSFKEAPARLPGNHRVSTPKSPSFFLKPTLDKDLEGETHLVKFNNGTILLDGQPIGPVISVDGLKTFLREVHPGYHQSFDDEALVLTSVLSDSQKSDLRHTGKCDFGDGDELHRIGAQLVFKEKHGSRFRNFTLTNVVHMNNWEKVPDSEILISPLRSAFRLETCGCSLTSLVGQGTVARSNILKQAKDGYFPLWLVPPPSLDLFYESTKGPPFRAFVLGDSLDVILSDLVHCYIQIMKDTASPSPDFCEYILPSDPRSKEYHPEAAFCACRIWINLDILEIMPVAIRIGRWLFPEDHDLPHYDTRIIYSYGRIDEVMVNLPTLWYLVEKLGFRMGIDLGIIEGTWVIPYGQPTYAWREWARNVEKAVSQFGQKFLYQMGATGGHFLEGTKTGEFMYSYQNVAFATEDPMLMSHLFDLQRVMGLIGATQSRNTKNIAADGWTSEGNAPDSIGPIKIGCVTYGPFIVQNKALELLYQFDQVKHDEIASIEENPGLWRPLAERYRHKKEIEYKVESATTYREGWKDPTKISLPKTRLFKYTPSMGDSIPLLPIELVGDTLGRETQGKASQISQVEERFDYIREPDVRRVKYA